MVVSFIELYAENYITESNPCQLSYLKKAHPHHIYHMNFNTMIYFNTHIYKINDKFNVFTAWKTIWNCGQILDLTIGTMDSKMYLFNLQSGTCDYATDWEEVFVENRSFGTWKINTRFIMHVHNLVGKRKYDCYKIRK